MKFLSKFFNPPMRNRMYTKHFSTPTKVNSKNEFDHAN